SSAEALDPRDAKHLLEDELIPIQQAHVDLAQDLGDLLRRAILKVVVSKHRRAGDAQRRELFGQHLRVFRSAAVGEVAAQEQEVGHFVDLAHELAETAVVVSAAVQISSRCDSYFRARVARHSSYLLVPSRPTRARLGSPTPECPPDNSRSREDFLGRSGPANRRAPTSLSPSISARTAPNSAPRFALRDK